MSLKHPMERLAEALAKDAALTDAVREACEWWEFNGAIIKDMPERLRLYNEAVENLQSSFALIVEAINAQAQDKALWSSPIGRLQTAQEAYLQESLRDLHRVIEDQDTEALKRIKEKMHD